jgi:hypothetical protein
MDGDSDRDLLSSLPAAAAAPSIDHGGDGPSFPPPPLPPPSSSPSSSSDSDGEEDEGWAPFVTEEDDDGLDLDQPVILSCRIRHLELPVDSAAFLGKQGIWGAGGWMIDRRHASD